jgi:hypothetical protein
LLLVVMQSLQNMKPPPAVSGSQISAKHETTTCC